MNARSYLLPLALITAVAAGVYHCFAIRTQAGLDGDRARVLARTAKQRRLNEEISRQVAAARSGLQAIPANRMNRPPSAPSSSRPASSPAQPKFAARPSDPELRRMQVQAHVSEQRLRFAALLKRLGFTPQQLQAFDRIEAACQQVMLDEAQNDAARRHAQNVREEQLKELFGADHRQWIEANRNQSARAVVSQIVQQTFQGSGALTAAQADELTHIVAQHRIPPSKEAGAGQPRYDWDRIVADANTLLANQQRDAFVTAINYRRVSDRMSALATKKK